MLDALIQRLQHPCIDRGDHVHRRIEFFFGHACFPCVRKATIHSRIAEPHHCDCEADQHLLALGEAFDGMRIAVEGSKISFLHGSCSSQPEGAACCVPTKSEISDLSTRSSALDLGRFHPGDQRVGKCALHVRVIAVGMPGEIVLLHTFGQLRVFLFDFQGRFEPMPARWDVIHAFLIE